VLHARDEERLLDDLGGFGEAGGDVPDGGVRRSAEVARRIDDPRRVPVLVTSGVPGSSAASTSNTAGSTS